MTSAPPETLERERHTLFVTDEEMIRRIGVPVKIARPVIHELDRKPTGFPKKKLWG